MVRIFDIALKDISQLARERELFLFMLIMPLIFTLLFGYIFGGFGGQGDTRLPVGFIDEDDTRMSRMLQDLLSKSDVIRLVRYSASGQAAMEAAFSEQDLVAALLIPKGYEHTILKGRSARITLIADTTSTGGLSVKSEVLTSANRLDSAVQTALALEEAAADQISFDYAISESLKAWEDPPIRMRETTSSLLMEEGEINGALAHTSPGMMLQFAIAGLLTVSQIIVSERKTRALQRLLTTATRRVHILLGHFLAFVVIISTQFLLLILFGQFILKVNYLRTPAATALLSFCAVIMVAAYGLLIGVLAKSNEQAIMASLVSMFVFAGLGGAWVQLEATSPTFQMIGHFTPLAWAMDGFMAILIRGQGIESIIIPAGMLAAYALTFFLVAAWRFQTSQES